MELTQCASELADESLTATEVLLILRTLGASERGQGIEQTLRVAAALYEEFLTLSHFLPNFPTERFLAARQLHRRLTSIHSSLPEYNSGNFWIEGNRFFKNFRQSFSDSGQLGPGSIKPKTLALAWLISAMQSWTPAHSAHSSIFDPNCPWSTIQAQTLAEQLTVIGNPFDHNSFLLKSSECFHREVMWLANFRKISDATNLSPRPAAVITVSSALLAPIRSNNGSSNLSHIDQRARRPREWSNLRHREKLETHHSAMPLDKVAILCDRLRKKLKEGGGDRVEALLVTLAICTAKNVDEVLSLAINNDATESINIRLHNGAYFAVWTRTIGSQGKILDEPPLSITLPDFLKTPLVGLINKSGANSVAECLTESCVPWAERTYSWLKDFLSVSKFSLQKKLKYLLPRRMYKDGANSAVLDALTRTLISPGLKKRHNPLSFYISYTNRNTHKTYVNAIKSLFNAYGPASYADLFQKRIVRDAAAENSGAALARYCRAKIENARNVRDLKEEHNWLARYTLLMLMAATGHRVSKTPFYFRHDLLIDEKFVFICDKNVVGSEARFVPIAEIVVAQVKEYLRHLSINVRHFPMYGDISAGQETVKLNEIDLKSGVAHSVNDKINRFTNGIFFTFDENWKPTPLSTKALEIEYGAKSRLTIKPFRSQLLTALGEMGAHGFDIEALAGHNEDLHVFGHASVWTVQSWGDRLRPTINEYLVNSGWEIIASGIPTIKGAGFCALNTLVPTFNMTNFAYEGRGQSAAEASKRARKAISEIFNHEFLERLEGRLESPTINEIKSQLNSRLHEDHSARAKAGRELKEWLDRLSYTVEVGSRPSLNFIRGEAGPIRVNFSRHFSIAALLRKAAPSKLGVFTPNISVGGEIGERLTQIAFSLIAYECVLDAHHLKGFIEAVAGDLAASDDLSDRVYRVLGHMAIRTRVMDSPFSFEKALVLSPITSAQIYALNQPRLKGKILGDPYKQIQKRLSNFIIRIIGRQPKSEWNINDLITVFKSWWFLRIPGALFSVATGQTRGPALDLASEVAFLYGTTPKNQLAPAASSRLSAERQLVPSMPPQIKVLKEFNKFLLSFQTPYESGGATLRRQRQALRQALAKPLSAEMGVLMQERQIVALLKDFILYMLIEGGSAKKILSVTTIRDYFSSIAQELIRTAWEIDLTEYSEDHFQEFYTKLKGDLAEKRHSATALALFHRFLQSEIDAPHVPGIGLGPSLPVRVRSAVLTPQQFDLAWALLSEDTNSDPLDQEYACQLLVMAYGHGMRAREATGFTVKDIVGETPCSLRIADNKIRSVKSRSPRVIWIDNGPIYARRWLKHQIKKIQVKPGADQALFADPASSQMSDDVPSPTLYKVRRYDDRLTSVLRTATGNPFLVKHSLRHTFFTALAAAVMPDTGYSAISSKFRGIILRDINIDSIWTPINGGRDAWPFAMELLAMMAGHESDATTVGSYVHGCHYHLASYTEHEFSLMRLRDQDVAAMLGVSASAFSQSLHTNSDKTEAHWVRQRKAIYSRFKRSKIIDAKDIIFNCGNVQGKDSKIEHSNGEPILAPTRQIDWCFLEGMLCYRQRSQLSLAEFKNLLIEEYNFKEANATLYVDAYKNLLNDTGFADFEPLNSELLRTAPKFMQGVKRGQRERHGFLHKAYTFARLSEICASEMQEFCVRWRENVHSDKPFIIAKSPSEAERFIRMLMTLGASSDQIVAQIDAPSEINLDSLIALIDINNVHLGNFGIDRGFRHLKKFEIGLNVKQCLSSKIPDGRDLHRSIFVMTMALSLELSLGGSSA